MKYPEKTRDRIGLIIVVFVISPLLGVLIFGSGALMLFGAFHAGKIDLGLAALSLSFVLIGLGLLQFSYFVIFEKASSLNAGILYFASIVFMVLGAFIILHLFLFPEDSGERDLRGAGIFIIGLIGYNYARSRKREQVRAINAERPAP